MRDAGSATATVVEVVTEFEGAVLDVRSIGGAPRVHRKWFAATAALGGAALLLLVLAFARVGARSILVDAVFFALVIAAYATLTQGLRRRLARAPREFTVGTDAAALVVVPEGVVPVGKFPLVRAGAAGCEITLAEGMEGEAFVDGEWRKLAGASTTALGKRTEARVRIGGMRFTIRVEPEWAGSEALGRLEHLGEEVDARLHE